MSSYEERGFSPIVRRVVPVLAGIIRRAPSAILRGHSTAGNRECRVYLQVSRAMQDLVQAGRSVSTLLALAPCEPPRKMHCLGGSSHALAIASRVSSGRVLFRIGWRGASYRVPVRADDAPLLD